MFPETLESTRLTYERLSHQTVDVSEMYEIFGTSPDVDEIFEYLDTRPHRTLKETFDRIRNAEDNFDDGEWAQYVLRPKPTEEHGGEIAGIAGLYPKWDRRFASLGIILDKRFWGNGYSAERAELFIEIAFEHLELDVVAVKYIDGNERSKRAIEKYVDRFGGRYEGLLRNWLAVDNDVYDCHRYTIHRDEYQESKSG